VIISDEMRQSLKKYTSWFITKSYYYFSDHI